MHKKLNVMWAKRTFTQVSKQSSNWKSVVGLEVHAQIASESKLFSGSGTIFHNAPNAGVSYFDASLPGTLPVINKKCVEMGIKTALALNCRVNEVSTFDRKHYFYADLPAGYQITQQRAALANDGVVTFPVIVPGKDVFYKTVSLLQLQLEQDSGKSLHDNELKRSLVDLNRAGLPLMELVFAPDLETGEEAASLVKELVLILKRLKSCSCKMEEGALRVDANISIHQVGQPLGTRTEVKNIGSVRNISQAITYEINRQLKVVRDGGVVLNETRSWDADGKRTVAMRDKEVLQDYRFFPEPNLPPLRLRVHENEVEGVISISAIKKEQPELPASTRESLIEEYRLSQEAAIILVNEDVLLQHFLHVTQELPALATKVVANFLINDFLTSCNKSNIDVQGCKISSTHLRDILTFLNADKINLKAARSLLGLIHENPSSDINSLIEKHNLQQISDDASIEKLCLQGIAAQSNAVQQYRNGKSKALLAIAGEVANISEQKANMKLVIICLKKLLKENNEGKQ